MFKMYTPFHQAILLVRNYAIFKEIKAQVHQGIIYNTGILPFIALFFIALCRYCIFYKLNVGSNCVIRWWLARF